MNNQNASQLAEKARNSVIAITLTASLILLEQVIHLPLWVSVPTAALAALFARYYYLKRNIGTHHKGSGQ